MNYTVHTIDYKDPNFVKICHYLEKAITQENLAINGGTLNYQGLTYRSDLLSLVSNGDNIVGYNSIVILEDSYYIYQIAIKKEYQQQGLGMMLMEEAMRIAKENNMDVTANAMDYNSNSVRMFERLGFTKLGYGSEGNGFYEFKQISKNKGSI